MHGAALSKLILRTFRFFCWERICPGKRVAAPDYIHSGPNRISFYYHARIGTQLKRIGIRAIAMNTWRIMQIKWFLGFYMRRELYLDISGNEVNYTNSLKLLVKNMLGCKPHCQKGFN